MIKTNVVGKQIKSTYSKSNSTIFKLVYTKEHAPIYCYFNSINAYVQYYKLNFI